MQLSSCFRQVFLQKSWDGVGDVSADVRLQRGESEYLVQFDLDQTFPYLNTVQFEKMNFPSVI